VLQFLKERGTTPTQEEMQIMDGLHIFLENGWLI
jgi:hypothetical protein